MKKCKWALCVALGIIAMSCIREEPLNAEADIESVTLSSSHNRKRQGDACR